MDKKVSLSIRRFWGKGAKNLLSPSPLGRPDTQAIRRFEKNTPPPPSIKILDPRVPIQDRIFPGTPERPDITCNLNFTSATFT